MNKAISIVEKQLSRVVDSWDEAIESYQDSILFWRDAEAHVDKIKNETRFLDSFNTIPWAEIIKSDTVALDVGCGSGWLSALLSKYNNLKIIYALDTSRTNLTKLMPQVVNILDGDESKIQPVIGLFDGLDILNEKFDLVVASAALHHSTNIRKTLSGIFDSLNAGGTLILLNELPSTKLRFVYRVIIGAFKTLRDISISRFPQETPMISSSGILYNRKLGDWTYCLDQWETYLNDAGFSVELIPLNFSQKSQDALGWRRENFINFICRKPV